MDKVLATRQADGVLGRRGMVSREDMPSYSAPPQILWWSNGRASHPVAPWAQFVLAMPQIRQPAWRLHTTTSLFAGSMLVKGWVMAREKTLPAALVALLGVPTTAPLAEEIVFVVQEAVADPGQEPNTTMSCFPVDPRFVVWVKEAIAGMADKLHGLLELQLNQTQPVSLYCRQACWLGVSAWKSTPL